MTQSRLEQIQTFLNFYFSLWSAAKPEVWESITNGPFCDEVAYAMIRRIMAGNYKFTEEQLNLMFSLS